MAERARSWSLETAREMLPRGARAHRRGGRGGRGARGAPRASSRPATPARAELEQRARRGGQRLGARDGGARRRGEGRLARRLRQRPRLLLLALARGAARVLPRLRRGLRRPGADPVGLTALGSRGPSRRARASCSNGPRTAAAGGVGRVGAHETRFEAAGARLRQRDLGVAEADEYAGEWEVRLVEALLRREHERSPELRGCVGEARAAPRAPRRRDPGEHALGDRRVRSASMPTPA